MVGTSWFLLFGTGSPSEMLVTWSTLEMTKNFGHIRISRNDESPKFPMFCERRYLYVA